MGTEKYSLVFRQLGVEVYRLYAHQLQVVIDNRCSKLVSRKLEAQEERSHCFGRHGDDGELQKLWGDSGSSRSREIRMVFPPVVVARVKSVRDGGRE